MKTSNDVSLEGLFRPSSVAVIGASPTPGNSRNSLLRVLVKHGFDGRIYPVTPTHAEVEGLRAYRRINELPETPDVALIITPAATVPALVDECGAFGTRHVIVFSAGFEESHEGQALAGQLVEAARRHGVTLIGPNCQGIWSVRHRALLTYSPAALNLDETRHAPIAIVSQSGAIAGALCTSLHRSGLGCSYMVSVGNESVFDALDALAWLVEQDDVRVVALYLEGLRRGARIREIAARARQRGVRIVALKAGRSELGQQTTASHTGKIASAHAVYSDVLDQAGVVSLDNLSDLLWAVEVLAYTALPRFGEGPDAGVSMLSSSGGAAALLADHSAEEGVPMARFSRATVDRLEQLLPEFARKDNPIDLTGQINQVAHLFRNTCTTVAEDPRTEALVVQHANSGRRYLDLDGDVYRDVARHMPVVVSFVGDTLPPETRQSFRASGVLLAPEPSASMRALGLLYRLRAADGRPEPADRPGLPTRGSPEDWAEMMAYCASAGAPPARWAVLGPENMAARACAELRYPLVVKVLPSDAEHKSELGLVKLRVANAEEVDRIAADFRTRMGKPSAGILVQEMAGDGVEVVVSFMRQSDFGPLLTIGSGGVAVELHRDVAHLALPVQADDVMRALRRLKLWTLLQGFRGKPATDVEALVQAVVRLGDQFLACPDLQEIELNPVIVQARGQGLVVVDALAVSQVAASH
jgi:acetate---CoA ligase (ADP-forming)